MAPLVTLVLTLYPNRVTITIYQAVWTLLSFLDYEGEIETHKGSRGENKQERQPESNEHVTKIRGVDLMVTRMCSKLSAIRSPQREASLRNLATHLLQATLAVSLQATLCQRASARWANLVQLARQRIALHAQAHQLVLKTRRALQRLGDARLCRVREMGCRGMSRSAIHGCCMNAGWRSRGWTCGHRGAESSGGTEAERRLRHVARCWCARGRTLLGT